MDQISQCGGDRVNGGNQAGMTTGAGQPLDLVDLGHLGTIRVTEDEDRFTITQDPCGSDGALTVGRKDFPSYCTQRSPSERNPGK
jgi:hypothetical protein